MKKIAFFDTKPYDRTWFDILAKHYEIAYFEEKLNRHTATLTDGFDAVCAFVNDRVDAAAIDRMHRAACSFWHCAAQASAMWICRQQRASWRVVRVPAYSPHAVAEHTMGLLLTLNRRLHRAYIRTRDFNFSIVGLTGIDLYKKTVGIIGTGRIGRAFAEICRGFGMRVLAYDKYPAPDFEYVSLDTLLRESDVISLHCPLSEESYHMLDREAFDKMKKGVFLLNTSRGALIDSEALLDALNNGTLRGAGLDVYEEEAKFFFEDHSDTAVQDDTLALLISRPNVILTAHQAFLTEEALYNIAEVTVQNLDDFFAGKPLKNEVCIRCAGN